MYAEDLTREGIFKAMLARHTFAGSDKIVVDFQILGHLPGDEFTAKKAPELSVKILGTAKLRSVEVVRNNASIYTVRPGAETASFQYKDAHPEAGTSYYYIRVIQDDQNMAWSSPIWVNLKK